MSKKEDITLLRKWEFEDDQEVNIEIVKKAFSDFFDGIATSVYLSEPSDMVRQEAGIGDTPAISICSDNSTYMRVHIATYYEKQTRVVVMGVIGKGQQVKAAELESFYAKCFGSISAFTNAVRAGKNRSLRIGGGALAGGIGAGVGFAIAGGVKLAAKGVKALLRDKEAYEKEMDFYRFAMSAGDFVLGGLDNGGFIEKLRTCAEEGNITAQYLLGCAYDEGRGVPQKHNVAVKFFEQAAAGGDKRSKIALISEYLFSDIEYDGAHAEKGITYLKELADAGEGWAIDELLSIYDKGTVSGVDVDLRKAQELAATYVHFGNVYAAMLVATGYDSFMAAGAFAKDDEKAAFLYQKAAESGDGNFAGEAAFYLARMYKEGRGVAQEAAEAVRYFEFANNAGIFQAKPELAHYYTFGNGIATNHSRAKKICDELIESGDPENVALGNYCRYYIADKETKYGESLQYAKAYLESDGAELERADEVNHYIEEKEKLLASMTEQERNEYLKIKTPKPPVLNGKKSKIIAIIVVCVVAAAIACFLLLSGDDKPVAATGTVEKSENSSTTALEPVEKSEDALPVLFQDGVASINTPDGCEFIDEDGNQIAMLDYSWVQPFSENGRAVARDYNSGKYGIIDKQGNEVCNFRFDVIWLNSSEKMELLPVCFDGKDGYIDWNGEEVIPFQFEEVHPFAENGLARVKIDGRWGYIDESGEMKIAAEFEDTYTAAMGDFAPNGLACVMKDRKYGYIDETGEYVIPAQYDAATDFNEFNLAVVTIGEKKGIIDSNGNYLLDCEYDNVGDMVQQGVPRYFDDYGYCRISNYDSGTALINTKGEFICPFDYVGIGDFCRAGLAPVRIAIDEDSSYAAFINTKNEIVLTTDYDFAGPFSENGLALVEKDERYGYINMDGEEVIPLQYKFAHNFNQFGLSIVNDEAAVYVINERGDELCSVPFSGDYCPWEIDLLEYDGGYTVAALYTMSSDVETRTLIFKNETLIYDSENR